MEIAGYASAVRVELPPEVFVPARGRILWLPVHVAIIATLAWTIPRLPSPLLPLASLAIGICMAFIAFLGHEVLHGAVVRGRAAIKLVGWICMLPFTLSPTLWTNWHNRVHHAHCARVGHDPDMYPTEAEYHADPSARMMADYFGLGGRRWRSAFSLLFGFTGQSQQMLWQARELGILTPRQWRRALVEFGLGVAGWTAIAFLIGGHAFIFVYAIPLVVANVIAMSFILTNHCLSSLTPDENDPLVNSLSVTLPRALEWLSLDFGYHVEHHVLPTISARHHRRVRAILLARFPERYQTMPLPRALRHLYRSGRVYRDPSTLLDPRTGETTPALGPRSL